MVAPAVLTVRPEAAQKELARRELGRRHLVDFSEYVAGYYRAAAHHRLLGEYLELVETYIRTQGRTGIGRLLILEPPRHGKSEQATIHFPAWALGRNPDIRVIISSYGADLAVTFSKQARDLVDSERYKAIFGELSTMETPVELADDSRSTKAWDLGKPHRGGMIATGVGGGITGRGANLFIVDDPFKNREEAESESNRERVWDWWTSTARTRLEQGAAVVGILTRWHGDDWAGRLLRAMAMDEKATKWTVLCLPAMWYDPVTPEGRDFEEYQREKMLEGVWIDERDPLGRKPGQALWPQKYNEDDLDAIARDIGLYDYEALYQQSPYSRSGDLFRREWFGIVETPPLTPPHSNTNGEGGISSRMWFIDTAGSKSGKSDYACAVCMSLSSDGIIYVENVARRQGTPKECDDLIVAALKADRLTGKPVHAIWHQQEGGDSGLRAAQMFNQLLGKEGFAGKFETLTGDKEVRAGPWSSALQGNQVRLVRGGWNEAFIEEHVTFPKGKFDDQVDCASWGYTKLMKRIKRAARSYQG